MPAPAASSPPRRGPQVGADVHSPLQFTGFLCVAVHSPPQFTELSVCRCAWPSAVYRARRCWMGTAFGPRHTQPWTVYRLAWGFLCMDVHSPLQFINTLCLPFCGPTLPQGSILVCVRASTRAALHGSPGWGTGLGLGPGPGALLASVQLPGRAPPGLPQGTELLRSWQGKWGHSRELWAWLGVGSLPALGRAPG